MRRSAQQWEDVRARAGAAGAGALGFAVLAGTSWGGIAPLTAAGPEVRTLVDGVLSGIFVAGAVIAAVVGWRRRERSPAGWVVDDAFAVGLGMGWVAAGHLVRLIEQDIPVGVPLVALLVLTLTVAAGRVLTERALPRPTAYLLTATVLVALSGFGVLVTGRQATGWDMLCSLALAAVGVAWLVAAWTCSERAIDSADARHREEVDSALLAQARTQREQLHELRSTVAGLVNGSEMLARADLSTEARLRLWDSVRRELGRMQRLLSGDDQAAAPLELDDALALILDLQRLKGRHVELHPSGDIVRARYDSLSEVVNILMDNAATHGGTDTSVVDVVRRDEDTVDITVTDFGRGIPDQERQRIFEWGERGSDSPGEGIGLHLAQRLVAADGGSLRLAEAAGVGSSFVISLPSPRHSPEVHPTDKDSHGARRCSG